MRRSIAVGLVALLMLIGAIGCPDHPVSEPVCGPDGDNVELPTDRELCVYRWPIVIETGFSCPAQRIDRTDFPRHFATCSDFGPPVEAERDFLLDRYGIPGRPWPTLEQSSPVAPTSEVDVLWVIDNSGSMCQEQQVLRENFAEFVGEFADRSLDLHIGVTTTDTNDDYPLEPVAEPGHLQATPQPVPGFDPSCHTAVDEMGNPIEGDYSPIRESLRVAVDCMAEPDETLLEVTDADIECALYNTPQGCSIEGRCTAQECGPESIFPDPSTYRPLPRVLRSSDYRVDSAVDVEAMQADFACMSLVGTRGYGIEKGLGAAVAAVSPGLTDGPNAGLLRDDARFAVMFVTDENDCTHDGSIEENTACGGDVCEFWNREDQLGGPLIPVAELKSQLLGNLSVSKGREIHQNEVFVGSIHGRSKRFEGERPTDQQCGMADYAGVPPTCATSLGAAYSGDRYERFLLQFPNGNFFPEPDEASSAVVGWMCRGDFSPALKALGGWLARAVDE